MSPLELLCPPEVVGSATSSAFSGSELSVVTQFASGLSFNSLRPKAPVRSQPVRNSSPQYISTEEDFPFLEIPVNISYSPPKRNFRFDQINFGGEYYKLCKSIEVTYDPQKFELYNSLLNLKAKSSIHEVEETFSEKFHALFHTLWNRSPNKMSDNDRRVWDILKTLVDFKEYRSRHPLPKTIKGIVQKIEKSAITVHLSGFANILERISFDEIVDSSVSLSSIKSGEWIIADIYKFSDRRIVRNLGKVPAPSSDPLKSAYYKEKNKSRTRLRPAE